MVPSDPKDLHTPWVVVDVTRWAYLQDVDVKYTQDPPVGERVDILVVFVRVVPGIFDVRQNHDVVVGGGWADNVLGTADVVGCVVDVENLVAVNALV